MSKHKILLQVRIGAVDMKQATLISETLVNKRIVAGTMISPGLCHYTWNNEFVEREYFDVRGYTQEQHKDTIISTVEQLHSDEAPVILFSEVEGSEKTAAWIDDIVNNPEDK